MNMDLQQLMDEVDAWQTKTFGHDRLRYNKTISAMMSHLIEEAEELKADAEMFWVNPNVQEPKEAKEYCSEEIREEFADCFMLIIGAAKKFNLTASELIADTKKKLEKNKNREWGEPDENGVVRHIKK